MPVGRPDTTGSPIGQTREVTAPEPLQCSAKGCHADARWALRWNNPKIHDADRRKIWLACDDHKEHLSTFLGRRGFLRDTIPVDDLP
ncbi:hypothetical protein GCM10010151_69730 [Actinoallomurus spadix]|uniref:Acetone carboxylase n=1 Tax=Actinoallomurus spadix TaxID=79912 RepID=A0ABN0XQ99_9ACTN